MSTKSRALGLFLACGLIWSAAGTVHGTARGTAHQTGDIVAPSSAPAPGAGEAPAPRVTQADPDEYVVDDLPIFCITTPCPGAVHGGPEDGWRESAASDTTYRNHAYYTFAGSRWVNEDDNNWMTWWPYLPSGGRWQIQAYIPVVRTGRADTTQALYRVNTANGVVVVSVDQTQGPGWVSLGTFTLDEGDTGWVQLRDVTPDSHYSSGGQLLQKTILFDAMRWTRQGGTPGSSVTVDAYLRNRPDGATVHVGDAVDFCFSVSRASVDIRFTYCAPGGCRTLAEWTDDGRGACYNATITEPTGMRRVIIEAFSAGRVIARDQTWFVVTDPLRTEPPAGYCDVRWLEATSNTCSGEFGVHAPVRQTIFRDYMNAPSPSTARVGPFGVGQDVTFYIQPGGRCGGEYLSTSGNALVTRTGTNNWRIEWEDLPTSIDNDFNDLVVSVACGVQAGSPPPVPADFKGVALSASEVKLTWTDTDNETGYHLEGANPNRDLPANSTSFTVTGLPPDTSVAFRLHARNSYGSSATDWLRVRTLPAGSPPPVPTGFQGVATSPTSVRLTWNDTPNETAYRVEGHGANVDLPENTTGHAITGLAPDASYMYRLHARNAFGQASTDWISVRTPAVVPPPPESADLGFRPNPNGHRSKNHRIARSQAMFEQMFGADRVYIRGTTTMCAASAKLFQEYLEAGGGHTRASPGAWLCSGYSLTSLFAFTGREQPGAGAYAIPRLDRLYDSAATAFEQSIAYFAGWQVSKGATDDYGTWISYAKGHDCDSGSARAVVDRVAQAIRESDPVYLALQAGGAYWHAVTPYRVVEESADRALVYIYDSETPGEERVVTFSKSGSAWRWAYDFQGSLAKYNVTAGKCDGAYVIRASVAARAAEPPSPLCNAQGGSATLTAFLPADGEWSVTDADGRRLGTISGNEVREIPGAVALPLTSGSGEAPRRAIRLPLGGYTMTMPWLTDATGGGTATTTRWMSGGRTIEVAVDAPSWSPIEPLRVSIPDGMKAATTSGVSGAQSLRVESGTTYSDHSRSALVEASGTVSAGALSAGFDGTAASFSAQGGRDAGAFRVVLTRIGSSTGTFDTGSLSLRGGAKYELVPLDWSRLDTTSAQLRIDDDGDGAFDRMETLRGRRNQVILPWLER